MRPLHLVLGLAGVAMTAYTFVVADAAAFREPKLARIVFFHLPCALVCSVLIAVAAYLGVRSLQTRRPEWDVRLAAATELGALTGALTMATGILFSKVQWGTWWHWDPRQTSFLIVLMLFVVALALRAGHHDEQRRAGACGAYAVLMVLPAVFLIFVYPRLPQVAQESFHPTQTVQTGAFDVWYRTGVYGTFAVLAVVTAVLYRLRVRAGLLELEVERRDGLDETHRRRATDPGVVRPVAVPKER